LNIPLIETPDRLQPLHVATDLLAIEIILRQHNPFLLIHKTPWAESASELCRLIDRHLSAKLVPTFADRGCHVVSVTDPYAHILGFLDRRRYFSIK
jgi:hypothetical protein